MSLIKIDKIYAGYGKENIIEDVSFEINEGELVGILGENGSGKSTLAKAICNIISHKGQVSVNECIIESMKPFQTARLISYIPQHSGINIDISILDVVMMGFNSRLKLLEHPDSSMEEEAKKMIDLVGLSDRTHTNYMLLSEGQKQLVILARALVGEGSLFVMDEPESALDFKVRYKIMSLIQNKIREEAKAGIAILHDIMLALNFCDRLILINDKKIVETIDLHNDTIESMEEKLGIIYGRIKLIKTEGQRKSLIMVYDSEEE